jgi:hypothetical protein
MKRNGYISIFPIPGNIVYLEAVESFVPDRRLAAAGVFMGLGSGKPNKYLPVLRVVALTRLPDLASALRRLVATARDPRLELGCVDRLTFAVDVSHETAGMIAGRRADEIARSLLRVRLALVEVVIADLPRPERRVWRLAVGRRAIAGTLLEVVEEGRLKLEVPSEIAREAIGQIGAMTAKPDRETPLEKETLARVVGLTTWIQSVYAQETDGGSPNAAPGSRRRRTDGVPRRRGPILTPAERA